MTENVWGFFSRRQKVKIPLDLMSVDDFFDVKLYFLKGQKSENSLASQQRLAPPQAGIIWYHMVA